MNPLRVHPAAIRLLKYQMLARAAQVVRGFQGGRRLVLSLLSALLVAVWLGQALIGLLFRESADPDSLKVWIPLSLTAYSIWHLLKSVCRKPIEPFEWTPAERELLGGAPLQRSELVTYRIASVGVAAMAKSLCFSVLMLPDLNVWSAGFVGMFLALLLVDLVRMAAEIYSYGISKRTFLRLRIAVLTVAATAVTSALISLCCSAESRNGVLATTSLASLIDFFMAMVDLRTTWPGIVAQAPFQIFARTILADSLSWSLLGLALASTALTYFMARFVVWLDRKYLQIRVDRERANCKELALAPCRGTTTTEPASNLDNNRSAVRVPRAFWGAGTLAWRQMLGAYHYRTSILFAVLVPAILSVLAVFSPQSTFSMVMQIVGGLVFYSFLLLPTALKFDFRRDIDRLATIKSLPIGPVAVTIGQLLVPIIITTLFQLTVLLVAMIVKPYHPASLLLSLLVLLPVNVLIFALENLIFMLYPYRLAEEGFGVFVRSILTFTAKGMLFGIASGVTMGWGLLVTRWGPELWPASGWAGSAVVFSLGMWILTSVLALGVTTILVGVYNRFDAVEDVPAIS